MNTTIIPAALIRAPLRNRMRLDLTAPLANVWALVGDPARMPEFSAGLERVEATTDARGHCTGYTCHFKPMQPGEAGIVSTDTIAWYEPQRGWASHGVSADAFGFTDDLHLVMLESSNDGTLVTWDSYYEAQDLAAMKAHMHEALSDIAQNILKRFGGRLIHCYVAE